MSGAQFVSLTGPQIDAIAGKDRGAALALRRIVTIVRNLAQGGDGVVARVSPLLPRLTVAEANALVSQATTTMAVAPVGLRVTISDSSTAAAPATFWGAITGGGANVVPAFWDGTVWRLA